jgi:hypothetical protein
MKKSLLFFFTIVLLSAFNTSGQEIRGLYINQTDSILGNPVLEKELLDYLAYGNFNSVSFYSLYRLNMRDSVVRANFRSFIRRARHDYGVERFGAVSESVSGFIDNIHLYNQDTLTKAQDRLDHYNIEFEFWSENTISSYYCARYLDTAGYSCDPDGAFSYACQMIKDLRQKTADVPGIQIEFYIGWVDEDHAVQLAQLVDRVLYAVYREMDSEGSVNLYNFKAQTRRLEHLASAGRVEVMPIFTSYDGSRDDNLASWLDQGHTVCEAWDEYFTGFLADDNLQNKQNLNIVGYQWFKYSSMPAIPVLLDAPGQIFGPRRLLVDSLARYSISPVQGATQYEWTIHKSGENFRRITRYPVFTKILSEPGPAMIQVRAIGCGKVSPYERLGITVSNVIFANDTLLLEDSSEDFNIRIAGGGIHLTIPKNKIGPFYIEAISLMGKRYLNKTIPQPGEYFLNFQQPADSIQFINVSITYPKGSFSKKFSILQQRNRPFEDVPKPSN